MQGFPDIVYEKSDGIARITLDRPGSGNAITARLHDSLRRAWIDIREDPAVRVAIVTGSGEKHFCTGADLRHIASEGYGSEDGPFEESVRLSARQNRVWKPVLSAVNGLVVGGGLHFVVDADMVIAEEHAEFMDTHVQVGQVGAVEMIGLMQRIPMGAALRMLLLGSSERVSAARALELGLVDEVVPSGTALETCERYAQIIASHSPEAVSASLQAMWSRTELGYTDSLRYGWSLLRLHRAHPDAAEGPLAFSEGRPPVWTV